MEFKDVIHSRYSYRRYDERPVPREKLTAIVEAAQLAPSGCNLQRWRFIIVDDPDKKAQLAEALTYPEYRLNTFTCRVPAFIVIVKQRVEIPAASANIIGDTDKGLWDKDIGIAAAYITLAATDMGLGSVILGRFRQEVIREALDIPGDLDIGLVVGVGYPQEPKSGPHSRRDLSEIMGINSYNG